MSILKDMGYDAVGIGENDLRIPRDRFFEVAAKSKLTIVTALPDALKPSLPYLIKNVSGVRVGIVSFGAIPKDGGAGDFVLRKSYYAAYKQARESSDILIVLDQANFVTPEWLERMGPRLGRPDIVVAGAQQQGLSEPRVIGRTRIVPTSLRTFAIGVLDVEVVPGEQPKYAWKRVENFWNNANHSQIKESAPEDPQVKAAITAFLKPQQVVPEPAGPAQTVTPGQVASQPTEGVKPYYSPELCKGCHVKEYDDWAKTKHAVAVAALMKENRMEAKCLKCHSDQYQRLASVTVPGPDGIGGVGCGTCHYDALPHGLERKAVAKRSKVNAVGCVDCHVKEHSPAYDEQVYFPKVSHLGAKGTAAAHWVNVR